MPSVLMPLIWISWGEPTMSVNVDIVEPRDGQAAAVGASPLAKRQIPRGLEGLEDLRVACVAGGDDLLDEVEPARTDWTTAPPRSATKVCGSLMLVMSGT
jgi:hypothetical protein